MVRKVTQSKVVDKQDDMTILDLEQLIGFELRRAYFASARKFVELLGDLAIKPGQYSILLAVDRAPDLTQTALARVLSLDRSTIVPLLDQLERKGLVQRIRKPNDRRSHALRLTPTGAWILRQSRDVVIGHEQIITAEISPANQKLLLEMLRQIRVNAQEDGSTEKPEPIL